jgi:uncharacterized membrane protein
MPSKPFIFFLTIVIGFGITLRLINLDQKLYWMDEGFTLLRASGYTGTEAERNLYRDQVISASDLLTFQRPSDEKGMFGTIRGLAVEEPQHPPLYFILTRVWEQRFGASKIATRSLPVIFSLLTFPILYWLCLELFGSPLVGWLSMAFFAVSPICLQFAQTARQYSLWLAIVLAACASLLQAIRNPTRVTWSLYAATLVVGLYTHLLTILVVIAHGIYILVIERSRFTKTVINFLLYAGISWVIAAPWLWVVWSHQEVANQTTEQLRRAIPLSALIRSCGISFGRSFFAWHFQYDSVLIWLTIPIAILTIAAFYFLYRQTPVRVWAFILLIMGATFLPFLLADLLLGGDRSAQGRYFLPGFVMIYLVLAYFLSSILLTRPNRLRQFRWGQWITTILISGGIVSSWTGSFASSWWGWSQFDVEIPPIVHQVAHPLVISDRRFFEMLTLGHQFHSDVNLLLLNPLWSH